MLLAVAVLLVALFGSAGRWNVPGFWAFCTLLLLAIAVAGSVIDPELAKERIRPGVGGEDRNLRWFVVPFLLAHLIVAGLDIGRFEWSPPLPTALSLIGLALLAASLGLFLWSMHVNRFFSPVVRIQDERGHCLVTAGPYHFVRHPGYAAVIGACAGSALALGSLWSAVPLIPPVVMILRRTIIEDRFLVENLDGYAEFAKQTRHRWVPGVW